MGLGSVPVQGVLQERSKKHSKFDILSATSRGIRAQDFSASSVSHDGSRKAHCHFSLGLKTWEIRGGLRAGMAEIDLSTSKAFFLAF